MKKAVVVCISMLLTAGATGITQAAEKKQDDDACSAVMCLVGKIDGDDGGDDCDPPIQRYFSIIATKKGKFSPSRTARERQKWLEKCATDNDSNAKKVNDKFGKLRGL